MEGMKMRDEEDGDGNEDGNEGEGGVPILMASSRAS
jgi:hypothetical protein